MGLLSKLKDSVKEKSADRLQIYASISILLALVLLSRLGLTTPDELVVTLLGVAIYTAVEITTYNLTEDRLSEPYPKAVSVVVALTLTVLSTISSTDLEAIIILLTGLIFYAKLVYSGLISDVENPLKPFRRGNIVAALLSVLFYLMGFTVIVGVFLLIIIVSVVFVSNFVL